MRLTPQTLQEQWQKEELVRRAKSIRELVAAMKEAAVSSDIMRVVETVFTDKTRAKRIVTYLSGTNRRKEDLTRALDAVKKGMKAASVMNKAIASELEDALDASAIKIILAAEDLDTDWDTKGAIIAAAIEKDIRLGAEEAAADLTRSWSIYPLDQVAVASWLFKEAGEGKVKRKAGEFTSYANKEFTKILVQAKAELASTRLLPAYTELDVTAIDALGTQIDSAYAAVAFTATPVDSGAISTFADQQVTLSNLRRIDAAVLTVDPKLQSTTKDTINEIIDASAPQAISTANMDAIKANALTLNGIIMPLRSAANPTAAVDAAKAAVIAQLGGNISARVTDTEMRDVPAVKSLISSVPSSVTAQNDTNMNAILSEPAISSMTPPKIAAATAAMKAKFAEDASAVVPIDNLRTAATTAAALVTAARMFSGAAPPLSSDAAPLQRGRKAGNLGGKRATLASTDQFDLDYDPI